MRGFVFVFSAVLGTVNAATIVVESGGAITVTGGGSETSSGGATAPTAEVNALQAQLTALQGTIAGLGAEIASLRTPRSCADVLRFQTPTSGVYNISVGDTVLPMYCNFGDYGWPAALVYRKAQAANTFFSQLNLPGLNSLGETSSAYGDVPLPNSAMGELHKLSDADINTLRSHSAVGNNLMVRITFGGTELGRAYHRATCPFQTVGAIHTDLPMGGPCSSSNQIGPTHMAGYVTTHSTQYQINGISRWYIDDDFGYIFPSIHIGSSPSGMTSHGSPTNMCRMHYSDDTFRNPCGQDAIFEVWAL